MPFVNSSRKSVNAWGKGGGRSPPSPTSTPHLKVATPVELRNNAIKQLAMGTVSSQNALDKFHQTFDVSTGSMS